MYLLGSTKVDQIEENLTSLSVAERLTADHLSHIDEILGNRPSDYQGWGGSGGRSIKTLE